MQTILITWTSWFIGFFLAQKLLERWDNIIWVDIENDYYDVSLKLSRRKILEGYKNFKFYKIKLEDLQNLEQVFIENKIDKVCNLAAQAWVRYSLENPSAYIQANLVWFHNIIELSKKYSVKNFVYASSSSVYGKNKKQPFSIEDKVDNPISLYAATKKSNELIAHSYSHLYNLQTIWLRFFTVYGPWSRPDMAMLKFALKMKEAKEIEIYNNWDMERDFTYIDDIVDGVIKALEYTGSNYEIFNLGNDQVVNLKYMIELLEKSLGIEAKKVYLPMQDWDVKSTWADIEYTKQKLNWKPTTSIEDGIQKFADWFFWYYK